MQLGRSVISLVVVMFCAGWLSPVSAEQSGTLAFVIRDWFTATYETRFMDECPEGLNRGQDEYWWRNLPKEERARITNNGLSSTGPLYYEIMDRGPNHEDVCLNPGLVVDPPLRVVEGKFGYGDNIDGTPDGHATAKSCKHEKFTSPDGRGVGIDNQLYRLVGCTFGWRKNGLVELFANTGRGNSGLGMILIEITGITDPRNSDNVTVTFYRSVDQFVYDGEGKPLPFSTYRIDTDNGTPRYNDSLKGRITDGMLETERGDVRLPVFYSDNNVLNTVVRDMALHLEISADASSATGMITGYYDVERFLYGALSTGQVIQVSQVSCPAIYVAAHRLADGYPDPKTGECTMLSSAFKIKAYAAFALHTQ